MHLFTSPASQQGTSVSFSYGCALTLMASTGQYPSGYSAYSALKLKFNLFNPFSFDRPTLRCREMWGVQGVLPPLSHDPGRVHLSFRAERVRFDDWNWAATLSKVSDTQVSTGKLQPFYVTYYRWFQCGMNPNYVRKRKEHAVIGPYETNTGPTTRPSGTRRSSLSW